MADKGLDLLMNVLLNVSICTLNKKSALPLLPEGTVKFIDIEDAY